VFLFFLKIKTLKNEKIFFYLRISLPGFEGYTNDSNGEKFIKDKFISKIENKKKRVHCHFSNENDNDIIATNFLLNSINDILLIQYLKRMDL
jgi:hypothetical protein